MYRLQWYEAFEDDPGIDITVRTKTICRVQRVNNEASKTLFAGRASLLNTRCVSIMAKYFGFRAGGEMKHKIQQKYHTDTILLKVSKNKAQIWCGFQERGGEDPVQMKSWLRLSGFYCPRSFCVRFSLFLWKLINQFILYFKAQFEETI